MPAQLMRDIAEIETTRDALDMLPVGIRAAPRRTQTLTLVPPTRSEALPVLIAGGLALIMMLAFGAAAAMSQFAR